MKIHAIILKNELPDDHLYWINACKYYSDEISYDIVDLTRNDWLDQINNRAFDVLLTKPSSLNSKFKQLYDERLYILERVLGYKMFPSAEEVFIYENKRFLSFWLAANKIPHPRTWVFYHLREAEFFLKSAFSSLDIEVRLWI